MPLPTIVIAEMLGVPTEQRDDFRRWSEDMVRGVFEPLDAAQQAEVAESGGQMGDWLDAQIAARDGHVGDDLISVLLRAEAEGGALTPDELRVFVVTLLVAGSITTAYLIGTATNLLAADPELLGAVRADLTRVRTVVEETLRYDTPVQIMFRTATSETEVAGTTIPRGATVLALLGSANRDERVFDRPAVFDPGRDASEHLAFGHGVHFCLGAALARLEARGRVGGTDHTCTAPRRGRPDGARHLTRVPRTDHASIPVQLTRHRSSLGAVNPEAASIVENETELRGCAGVW